MIRTFNYSFEPATLCPIKGNSAELTLDEIEDAGIREVLQTPGAALGSWAFLDALLAPTGAGSPFVFKEPLGQAREVKVALSGLFGRFIARAYLERYFSLSIFAHLGPRVFMLDGSVGVELKRKSRGDLPDWLACNAKLQNLTIAEAKGCHDRVGAGKALERAWTQANRVDVVVASRKAAAKRIAIATRWGAAVGGASTPILAVRDPDQEGEMSNKEMEAAFVGLIRIHLANLLRPLGYAELAGSIKSLAANRSTRFMSRALESAKHALDAAPIRDIPVATEGREPGPHDSLLGNWVTRAGPIRESALSAADQQALQRLDFRPVFVGVERQLVNAAIIGEPTLIREITGRERLAVGRTRTDGAGVWMMRPVQI